MAEAYGLAEGIVSAFEGHEKDVKERKDREDELKARQMKFSQMQNQLNQEGFKESVQRLMMGDAQGAMDHWNATGKQRMSDLAYDPETGDVSWTEEDTGEEHELPINAMAAMAGVDLPAPTKPLKAWKAGPAKSGIMYHEVTGEVKKGWDTSDEDNYRGSGMSKSDYVKLRAKDEGVIRDHFEKMYGQEFEMGKWAIKGDSKRLYQDLSTLAVKVLNDTPYEIRPDYIQQKIQEKIEPLLQTEEAIRKEVTAEADKMTTLGNWPDDKMGISYKDWIDKKVKEKIADNTKQIKDFIKDKAGVMVYIAGGAIPEGYGAPGGIPVQETAIPEDADKVPPPTGAATPAPAPGATAPAQSTRQATPPGYNQARYQQLGGTGKTPVGTPVGKYPSGQPIYEGQTITLTDRKSGKKVPAMVVNGQAVPIQ